MRWYNSPVLWRSSISTAVAILAGIETCLAVSTVSLDNIWGQPSWFLKLLFAIVFFTLLVFAVFMFKYIRAKKRISLKVRGVKVKIEVGDIFQAVGWKVIAFNEYFDVIVDDIVIAHNSLNGAFIDSYVDDIAELRDTIRNATENTKYKKQERDGRMVYPLGRIITYKDFMLLAFTHFDNNQAHLSQADYEYCLRVMWTEIDRTYANKPVFLPLLGSGITRFDGTPHKSKFDLLRCMLCTLRTSEAKLNQPITILLTKEAMEEINVYELKGFK